MNLRIIALLAGVAMLTACEAPSDTDGTAGGTGSNTYGTGQNGAPLGVGEGELAQGVGDRVFFGYDSSVVTAEGQNTLQRQADWLKANSGVNISIEGHCDERGTREYNLALGERRATAARNYLVSLGVNPARVTTVSYGKERPAVLGSNESSWAKNRRAVTVISSGY